MKKKLYLLFSFLPALVSLSFNIGAHYLILNYGENFYDEGECEYKILDNKIITVNAFSFIGTYIGTLATIGCTLKLNSRGIPYTYNHNTNY